MDANSFKAFMDQVSAETADIARQIAESDARIENENTIRKGLFQKRDELRAFFETGKSALTRRKANGTAETKAPATDESGNPLPAKKRGRPSKADKAAAIAAQNAGETVTQ